MSNKIVISIGDPNSVSPEIVIKALNRITEEVQVVLFASKSLMEFYSEKLKLQLTNKNVELIDIGFEMDFEPGVENAESGEYSYLALTKAIEYCKENGINALATAPISKNAINLAGYKYSGQTEILQAKLAQVGNQAQMLFVSRDFRILLLTRHIALQEVPKLLSRELIITSIKQAQNSLQTQLNIPNPSFGICALNPHAGENGLIGNEEKNIVIPALELLKAGGVNVKGPFPADTLFVNAITSYLNGRKQEYDCYVACFHDQGLIPIKSIAQDETLNITIGLSVLRTSPAHGTAYDIAGKNIAKYSGMLQAIEFFLS